MPYASKSEQRIARSTGAVAADRVVTSTDTPERKTMPQDKTQLTGGKMGSAKATKLYGGTGMPSANSGALFGAIGSSGVRSTVSYGGSQNSNGKNTTREKLGESHPGFPSHATTGKMGKPSGKQGMHHHPLMGKLGNPRGTK